MLHPTYILLISRSMLFSVQVNPSIKVEFGEYADQSG